MKKVLAVWVVFLMVMGGLFGIVNLSTDTEAGSRDAEIRSASQPKSGLTAHDPIYIDSNDDFIIGQNGVVSGSGTAGSPYIIENWDIDASSADGIYVRNTDVYFIVRNCVIHDGESNDNDGIYFEQSVQNSKIENCQIYDNYDGIYLRFHSSNNQITSNHIYNNNKNGIFLKYSSFNNIIHSNYIYNNNYHGIHLWDTTNNNTITSNHIYNNYYKGVYLELCGHNKITSNKIYNNSYGIYLGSSAYNEVHYNNIYNNTNYGIYNSQTGSVYVVDATQNWWGSASGPYHPDTNPDGAGDKISDNVLYTPWLKEEEGGEEAKPFEIPWLYIIIPVIVIAVIVGVGIGVKHRKRRISVHPVQPPMSPQQHPCPYCRQPLSFIKQHNRWYCGKCKRYI